MDAANNDDFPAKHNPGEINPARAMAPGPAVPGGVFDAKKRRPLP